MFWDPWSSGRGKANLCGKSIRTVVAFVGVWAGMDGEEA